MYGRGLRSIRTRFTLLVAGSCLAGVLLVMLLNPLQSLGGAFSPATLALLVAVIGVPAIVTFFLSGQLVGSIKALKSSTEAILAGDFDRPVEVDCQCEVGGLADSFQRMVGRLNSNILRMNALAYTDVVTGLANRTVLRHALAMALEEPATPEPLTVLFIDLDGFKAVNDTLGHDVGDELLRQVAIRLVESGFGMRVEDLDAGVTPFGELINRPPRSLMFGRIAGDEFVAILPGACSRVDLEQICGALTAALRDAFMIKGRAVRVGASIGVALAPEDADNAADLLIDADMAMYSAKQQGRGRHVFFDSSLRERMMERHSLEADLKVAVTANQFVVHYQPKVDAETLEVAGYEALVRWQHPTRGLLMPGQFLDLAEKNDLICEIGAIVFLHVLEQLKRWMAEGRALPVAVNVSPSQFRNPELCSRIRRMLRDNDIPPRLIEIEITEQVAMEDSVTADEKLQRLRALGIRLVIDDFGVGYSNLTQLVNLPFDVLKIDRSLVEEIGLSTKSETVIQAIVHLAHQMGHRTVAEGIETEAQLAFLRRTGCDELQGYLLGRPVPAERLIHQQVSHAA